MQMFDKPRQFWPIFMIIFLGGITWIWTSIVQDQDSLTTSPFPGFIAPDFELQTLDGDLVRLSELRGQVVVINLWASWCGPCRAEMPAMEEVYQRRGDEPFEILAVNMTYQDDAEAAANFVAENQLTFPILLDQTGEVGPAYRLEALPTTFFIDAEGIVREIVPGGPMNKALIQSKIQRLLADED